MHIAYKFELKPTLEQEVLLWKNFKAVRFVYNHFLAERKAQYDATQKSDNYYEQASKLPGLKKTEEFAFLKEANSQSIQVSLKRLDGAFNGFFKHISAYPKFHSCRDKQSFHVPQSFKLRKGELFIPKFKDGIKAIIHRPLQGKPCFCDVSYTTDGKYWVSITCEVEVEHLPATGKTVGIDMGIKDLVVTSDGEKFANPKNTKKNAKRLKRQQQHLSRKQKGSHKRNKQTRKVARVHSRITRARHDTLHKISTELVKRYDVICLEDLNVKGMVRNRHLSKHIADASWGTLRRFITYKANLYGRRVATVSTFYPSSKTCHDCKSVNDRLKLNDRSWACHNCGKPHDRDVNAAKNIRDEGLLHLRQELSNTPPERSTSPLRKLAGNLSERGKVLAY